MRCRLQRCRGAADVQAVRDVPRPGFLPPVLGDSWAFLQDWEGYFSRRVSELGPVFQTNVLGTVRTTRTTRQRLRLYRSPGLTDELRRHRDAMA